MKAGDADAGEQLREAAVGAGVAEGRAVQQELIAGRGQEDIAFAIAFAGERGLQFGPGLFDLLGGTGMVKAVQARELQHDVEITHEGPGRGRARQDVLRRAHGRLTRDAFDLTAPNSG